MFLLASCGYQSIYANKSSNNFIFQEIVLEGETNINKKIKETLKIKEDTGAVEKNKLLIKSNFLIEETSKNSKGQVSSYRSKLLVKLTITKNNKLIKEKNFTQDFNYGNRDNKFDLVKYQNEVRNNIIREVTEKINIFLNLE